MQPVQCALPSPYYRCSAQHSTAPAALPRLHINTYTAELETSAIRGRSGGETDRHKARLASKIEMHTSIKFHDPDALP